MINVDVAEARRRLSHGNTSTHRRELARATWFAIEEAVWLLHVMVLETVRSAPLAADSDRRASASTDRVQPGAKLHERSQVPALLCACIRMARRLYPDGALPADWRTGAGLTQLRRTLRVRDRVLRPRTVSDLDVTSTEIREALAANDWVRTIVRQVCEAAVRAGEKSRDTLR